MLMEQKHGGVVTTRLCNVQKAESRGNALCARSRSPIARLQGTSDKPIKEEWLVIFECQETVKGTASLKSHLVEA
jgi:hypothetical protein